MSHQFWKCNNAETLGNLFRFLQEMMPEKGWRVEFKPWKESRSLSQNALSWKWYKEIADQIHAKTGMGPFSDQDIHDRLLVECFGHETLKVGNVEVTRPFQTSKFDTAKMQHFMQWVEAWAAERNLRLTIPADSAYQQYKEVQR